MTAAFSFRIHGRRRPGRHTPHAHIPIDLPFGRDRSFSRPDRHMPGCLARFLLWKTIHGVRLALSQVATNLRPTRGLKAARQRSD